MLSIVRCSIHTGGRQGSTVHFHFGIEKRSHTELAYNVLIYSHWSILAMRHGKDYQEHFAHLLEHLVGEASSECEKLCPVDDSKQGGIFRDYELLRNSTRVRGAKCTHTSGGDDKDGILWWR